MRPQGKARALSPGGSRRTRLLAVPASHVVRARQREGLWIDKAPSGLQHRHRWQKVSPATHPRILHADVRDRANCGVRGHRLLPAIGGLCALLTCVSCSLHAGCLVVRSGLPRPVRARQTLLHRQSVHAENGDLGPGVSKTGRAL